MSPGKMTEEGIPLIDMSAWLSLDSSEDDREMLMSELRHASSTYGFFQLVGHGIPVHLMERVLKCGKLFFDLPTSEKMDVAMMRSQGRATRGYEVLRSQTTQKGALPDLKEVRSTRACSISLTSMDLTSIRAGLRDRPRGVC